MKSIVQMHNFREHFALTRNDYKTEEAPRFRFDFLSKYNATHWISRRWCYECCTMMNIMIQINATVYFFIDCSSHHARGRPIKIKCVVCAVAVTVNPIKSINHFINGLIVLTSVIIRSHQQRCTIKCFRQIVDVQFICYTKCGYNAHTKPQNYHNIDEWPHFVNENYSNLFDNKMP